MLERWDDAANLFTKLSPKKIYNAAKILSSYYASQRTGKASLRGLPISIAFEPTTSCNLRCPECPSGLRSFTRPTGMLQEEIFKKTIDELHETLLYLTFYFQGEPYLHPKFLDLVSYASRKGIYTATSTNAHYLDDQRARQTVESGLDRLIISIDGMTQETYEMYRVGGTLQKVIDGTKNILRWKKELRSKTPHLILQFLVVRHNEHEIAALRKFAAEVGINDVKLKTAQIYDYENGSDLIPTIDYYSRYQQGDDGKYRIKNSLDNHCWKMWHSCVITWDGIVVPCCFDKDAQHRLGNVGEHKFESIWFSDTYRTFRQALLKSRSEIDICKNCSEGTTVWS